MADNIKIWCLLIDHDYQPTLGEPFPVSIRRDGTIHELKTEIYRNLPIFLGRALANNIEIWKCQSSRLSAKDPFDQTKGQLNEISFSGNWKGHVEHLGTAQKVKELGLEHNEPLLAVMPRKGTPCLFLFSIFFTQLHMSLIA
jgi:hypothetical protein